LALTEISFNKGSFTAEEVGVTLGMWNGEYATVVYDTGRWIVAGREVILPQALISGVLDHPGYPTSQMKANPAAASLPKYPRLTSALWGRQGNTVGFTPLIDQEEDVSIESIYFEVTDFYDDAYIMWIQYVIPPEAETYNTSRLEAAYFINGQSLGSFMEDWGLGFIIGGLPTVELPIPEFVINSPDGELKVYASKPMIEVDIFQPTETQAYPKLTVHPVEDETITLSEVDGMLNPQLFEYSLDYGTSWEQFPIEGLVFPGGVRLRARIDAGPRAQVHVKAHLGVK
jgi:hypothetical protein